MFFSVLLPSICSCQLVCPIHFLDIIVFDIPSYSTASSKYLKMSEHSESTAEKLMGNIMDTIADRLPKQKSDNIMSNIMDTISDKLPKQRSGRFDPGSVADVKNKMFGRQRSLHGVLGGGKCTSSYLLMCLLTFSPCGHF